MKYYFFVTILLLSNFSAQSECESISSISDPLRSPQPIINIAFSYPGGLDNLPGVEKDIPRMRNINKRLYGNPGSLFRDNDVLESCERIVSGESCQKMRKTRFIEKMKRFIRDRQTRPIFNYSGHGFRCQRPGEEIEFCFMLPSDEVPVECELGEFGLVTLNQGCEDFFLTTEEVVENFNPKMIIADACHSGQMTLDINRMFSTTTVIASSLSHEKSSDWGLLYSLLNTMVNSKDEDLCRLDIDGDGEVSLPESLFGIYGSNLKYYRKALSMRNNEDNHIRDDAQFPSFAGFSSLDKDFNRCFIRPRNRDSCSAQIADSSGESNQCSTLVSKMNLVKINVEQIIDNPDSTKFLYDLSSGFMPSLSGLSREFKSLNDAQKRVVQQEYKKNLSAISDYLKGYLNNYFYPAQLSCQTAGEYCSVEQSFYEFIILKNKLDDIQKIHQYVNN